jgi:putative membrane protein
MQEKIGPVGTLLIVLVVAGAIAVVGMGMVGPMMGPGMMWGYRGFPGADLGNWGWWAMMGLGWVAMVAFWGAVIVGIGLFVRWLAGQSGEPRREPEREEPLAILQRRYARGEIDGETYERMKRELAA